MREVTGNTVNWQQGDRIRYEFDTGETLDGYVADIHIVPGFTTRIERATLRFDGHPWRTVEGCPDTLATVAKRYVYSSTLATGKREIDR